MSLNYVFNQFLLIFIVPVTSFEQRPLRYFGAYVPDSNQESSRPTAERYMREYAWPSAPNQVPVEPSPSPKSCVCYENVATSFCNYSTNERTYGKCYFPRQQNGICYKGFFREHLSNSNATVDRFEGCSFANDSNFDFRRIITFYSEFAFTVEIHTRTEFFEKHFYNLNCFEKAEIPSPSNHPVLSCPCTPDGMPAKFEKLCKKASVNNDYRLCSLAEMIREMKLEGRNTFAFCTDWGDRRKGCHVGVIADGDHSPYLAEIVVNVNGTVKKLMFQAVTGNYDGNTFGNEMNCRFWGDDQLLARITTTTLAVTTEADEPVIDPKRIAGPVGAVVTIFLGIINVLFICINSYRIYKIEKQWAKIDKDRAELLQARAKTLIGCNANTSKNQASQSIPKTSKSTLLQVKKTSPKAAENKKLSSPSSLSKKASESKLSTESSLSKPAVSSSASMDKSKKVSKTALPKKLATKLSSKSQFVTKQSSKFTQKTSNKSNR